MTETHRIDVDGESFDVVREGATTHFSWMSGPNPGYGFSIGGLSASGLGDEGLQSAIRGFLSGIDPATGYLAE